MEDAILLKIVLILVDTPGIMAPAETATKPAISAYSIRSWPWLSVQIRAEISARYKDGKRLNNFDMGCS